MQTEQQGGCDHDSVRQLWLQGTGYIHFKPDIAEFRAIREPGVQL